VFQAAAVPSVVVAGVCTKTCQSTQHQQQSNHTHTHTHTYNGIHTSIDTHTSWDNMKNVLENMFVIHNRQR